MTTLAAAPTSVPLTWAADGRIGDAPPHSATAVEVVVPVHDEERTLAASISRLRAYLDRRFPLSTLVTIADNASTDRTWEIARQLTATLPGVRAARLERKGRGRALRAVWSASSSRVVAYMDVDLSTDLDALLPLVAPLLSGHSDVSIGTRLAHGARVVRGPKREVISRAYNLIVRSVVHNRFSDAQCGFKAVRADAARRLLPMVEDDAWFFDTELLITAEHLGMRIHEVPVDWVDDPDSRVDVARTAVDDLKGLWRVVRRLPASGQGTEREPDGEGEGARWWASLGSTLRPESHESGLLRRFAGVGMVSTATYLVLFSLLRGALGIYGANALALVVTTAGNVAAHARFTFAARGRFTLSSCVLGGVSTFVTSVALTSLALATCVGLVGASGVVEAAAVVVGTVAAAMVRFVMLQAWTFRSHSHSHSHSHSRSAPATGAPPTR